MSINQLSSNLARSSSNRYVSDLKQDDLNQPIIVAPATGMQDTDRVYNTYILTQNELRNKRTQVRISFDVWARKNSQGAAYVRLRRKHIVLSLPTSEQAELAMGIIEQVCAQMAGKHLVGAK